MREDRRQSFQTRFRARPGEHLSKVRLSRFSDQGSKGDGFPSQVQKVYEELTGKKLTALVEEPHLARKAHAHSHGVA